MTSDLKAKLVKELLENLVKVIEESGGDDSLFLFITDIVETVARGGYIGYVRFSVEEFRIRKIEYTEVKNIDRLRLGLEEAMLGDERAN